jgi:hypothetical protein
MARLLPVPERTALVEKLAHRVRRASKLRLFRMWKLVGKHRGEVGPVAETVPAEAIAPAPVSEAPLAVRPLAERLAWLGRSRRL